MKMLPHCHPVEAQLLAFITTDLNSNVREIPEKNNQDMYIHKYCLFLT